MCSVSTCPSLKLKFESFILWQFDVTVGWGQSNTGLGRHPDTYPQLQTFPLSLGFFCECVSSHWSLSFAQGGPDCTFPFIKDSALNGPISKLGNLQPPALKLSPGSATNSHTSDKFADLSSLWACSPAAKHLMWPQRCWWFHDLCLCAAAAQLLQFHLAYLHCCLSQCPSQNPNLRSFL